MDSAAITGAFTLGGVVVGGLTNWAVLVFQQSVVRRTETRQAGRLVALATARIALAGSLGAQDREAIDSSTFESLVRDPAAELTRFADGLAKLSDDDTWDAFRRLQLALDHVLLVPLTEVRRAHWNDLESEAEGLRDLLGGRAGRDL